MHNIKFLLPIFLLISCQPPADVNEYTYPIDNDLFQSSIDVGIGFDELWGKLITGVGDFYEFSSQDKDAGEMIFLFTLEEASKYIDCGMMNDEIYVDYIDRIFESTLDGQINIRAESVSPNITNINLVSEFRFISKETGTRWAFKTNDPKSILVGNPAYGLDPYRQCQSKNFLEAVVLKQITSLE